LGKKRRPHPQRPPKRGLPVPPAPDTRSVTTRAERFFESVESPTASCQAAGAQAAPPAPTQPPLPFGGAGRWAPASSLPTPGPAPLPPPGQPSPRKNARDFFCFFARGTIALFPTNWRRNFLGGSHPLSTGLGPQAPRPGLFPPYYCEASPFLTEGVPGGGPVHPCSVFLCFPRFPPPSLPRSPRALVRRGPISPSHYVYQ